MLRKLFGFWHPKSLLSEMIERFTQMIKGGKRMFESVTEKFVRQERLEPAFEELRARDKEINLAEQAIRRMIVEHLVVNPKEDLPACLILMSVVKDAERIGDYCKNIAEVARKVKPIKREDEYFKLLKSMRGNILELFQWAIDAFAKSDVALAQKIIKKKFSITSRCDSMVDKILDEESPHKNSTAYALLFRYYKRITSHIVNITTSVVTSVDRIDFVDYGQNQGKGSSLPKKTQ